MNVKKINFPVFLVFALAIAFSIKGLREPDLWWQIRTGEWILQNHKVPTTDIFSFTNYGVNWINIKWGFEVLAAFICSLWGPESVFFLQIIVSILLFYFLLKTIKLLNDFEPTLFLLLSMFTFLGIEYRIIGRPEMFSHLFLVLYLYLLFLYKNGKNRILWLFIPLQIVWTNMHEAYGIGIVLLVIYSICSWIEYYKWQKPKPTTLSIVSILSVFCMAINPRGILLITRPLNIFQQVQSNKFTSELSNIFDKEYWQKEAFLMVLVFIILLVFILKNNVKAIIDKFSLGYFVILLAFLFLATTAYRNIIFFILLSFPLLNHILKSTFVNLQKCKKLIMVIAILFYISIVSNKYYTFTKSHDVYGMAVLGNFNAIGASEYIVQNKLANEKCFSDYLSSSYLLWKLQPNFKTFIDLRDLDVFTDSFFYHYLDIVSNPKKFFALDKKENFKYVVLYRNATPLLHAALYADSIYTCKYVDAVAAVYVKTDEVNYQDIFSPLQSATNSDFANLVNKIANPFYSPIEYAEINYDKVAADYYYSVGKLKLAEKRVDNSLQTNAEDSKAIELKNKITALKKQIK